MTHSTNHALTLSYCFSACSLPFVMPVLHGSCLCIQITIFSLIDMFNIWRARPSVQPLVASSSLLTGFDRSLYCNTITRVLPFLFPRLKEARRKKELESKSRFFSQLKNIGNRSKALSFSIKRNLYRFSCSIQYLSSGVKLNITGMDFDRRVYWNNITRESLLRSILRL